MSSKTDEEKGRWDQVMEGFDLLFARVNDIGLIQQEMKKDFQDQREAQRVMSQQVQANGQAVAALTLRTMEAEAQYDNSEEKSILSEEEPSFTNVFGKEKDIVEPSRKSKNKREQPKIDSLPHHTLPKMPFPKFDGSSPKIWIDNCTNYFIIYSIPTNLQVTAATMHLQDNAAKWWQAYK
jgi:hypothetical protein